MMIKIKAYAKVNLFLHAKRKRKDGFHELETIFERIDLCDTLIFSPNDSEIKLTVSGQGLKGGKDNLVYKAAELLKNRYFVSQGVKIYLKKNIPVAAGLGGGSSDAASTLIALNRFWKLNLSTKTLIKYAALLGSDVAFFILNKSYAIGRGRGEKLKVITTPLKIWHILINPGIHVSTKEVYGGFTPASLTSSKPGAKMLSNFIRRKNFQTLNHLLFNNLEVVSLKKYSILRRIKEDLIRAGAETALVSGSGPTVYGVAKSKIAAQRIARRLKRMHPKKRVIITSTA